jgi:hypothetical protein
MLAVVIKGIEMIELAFESSIQDISFRFPYECNKRSTAAPPRK